MTNGENGPRIHTLVRKTPSEAKIHLRRVLEREVDGLAARASPWVAPVLEPFAPLIEREPGVDGVVLKPLSDEVLELVGGKLRKHLDGNVWL